MSDIPADAVWLRPGQIAQRAGVAVSTLHYYEQLGLITSRRTAGNHREYRRDTLRLIAFVRASQRLGIPLATIKSALDDLPHDHPPTKRDWARLARLWRSDLDDRIDRLVALRDNLANCIACGCLSLTACPYTNPGDALGKEGPGARGLEPASTRHDPAES
ncbi:MAG: redox-sensitive transcriptional activator SoxR [Rhodococcus sp.]|uniref:redox-sensitive transcriptional activator SoxR n=1 Tax=Rhodococcus TaxID=1827 RepID=UPI0016AB6431|nr:MULTISPECIES: redox-sensitive transcriptional activator SoxR [Rhodococcus]NLV80541.1 redox-sensitive transcriptional activator SoxR [Rhodococcus sp. (in: high G+C Gram-positive bacteria)]